MDNNTMGPTNPQMPNPAQSPTPNPMPKISPSKPGLGSTIATIVIIVLIVLGALYFWGKRIETEQANQAAYQSAGTTTDMAAAEAAQIQTVSQDDSLSTLQQETQSTNTSNLDAEIK